MDQIEKVKDYYGKVLKTKEDLQTTACCTAEAFPSHILPLIKNIDDEIKDKFYGCGAPFPTSLEGLSVLDLGCGTGRDVYLLSQLVGESGKVIGIDMTEEQLEVARRHEASHIEKFGFSNSNVKFVKGYIEDLSSAGVESNSIDLIVSNCVVNLSPDKKEVFKEAFRVLKTGGELYFSDVFCDRRLSKEAQEDKVLLGECLGGALYIEDFRRLLNEAGCSDYRTISESEIEILNPEVRAKVGGARFYSITVRAFKLPLEDTCEDYGQVAYYKGTMPESPLGFELDDHHYFEKDRPLLVCANTALMLQETRFKDHFRVEGDTSKHFGIFDCSGDVVAEEALEAGACC